MATNTSRVVSAESISWQNQQFIRLRDSVQNNERALATLEEESDQCSLTAIRNVTAGDRLRTIFDQEVITPQIEDEQAQRLLLSRIRSLLSTLNSETTTTNRRRSDLAPQIQSLRQTLSTQRLQLKGMGGDNVECVITLEDIRDSFSRIDEIDPQSVFLMPSYNGSPAIRWVFSGLYLTPDYNPSWFESELEGLEDIYIPLADVVIIVNPQRASVKMCPRPAQRRKSPFYWGRANRVHPHVLDGDTPCLGSYDDPFATAIAEKDWAMLAVTFKLMLQGAATGDSAGRHWTKFFSKVLLMHFGDEEADLDVTGSYISRRGVQYKIVQAKAKGRFFLVERNDPSVRVKLPALY